MINECFGEAKTNKHQTPNSEMFSPTNKLHEINSMEQPLAGAASSRYAAIDGVAEFDKANLCKRISNIKILLKIFELI